MPILPKVARRSPRIRLVVLLIYTLLTLGSLTMVYPFMIMLTSSFSNRYDYDKFQALPTAMWRQKELIWKYVFERYHRDRFADVATMYGFDRRMNGWEVLANTPGDSFRYFDGPRALLAADADAARRRTDDWLACLESVEPSRFTPLHPEDSTEAFQDFLREKYGSMDGLSRSWGVAFGGFHQIILFYEIDSVPQWYPPRGTPRYDDLLAFKETLPANRRMPVMARVLWHAHLNAVGSLDEMNRRWGTSYESRAEVPFSFHEPPVEAARDVWETFLQTRYPRRLITLKNDSLARRRPAFSTYLRERFGSIGDLNRIVGGSFASFEEVPLPAGPPANGVLRAHWTTFITEEVPYTEFTFWSGETHYRDHLLRTYGTLEAIRRTHGAEYASLDAIDPPCALLDYLAFSELGGAYALKAPLDNYRRVIQFITTKGYALRNTIALVLLSVLGALTVNPLAAYALSRYSLRSSHRILIFLLATMAFPAEVAMIPNFLMLRELHLLNTYAALILPGLANGFSIFLLKGFFDSLPRELYEAARIDGASEIRTFLTITMPLSKPILAVIALNVFVRAYSSFMWAFVVCQKQSMWTMMVWLYQFQQSYMDSQPHLVMASICVACVPTLLVFLFCQRIILRGIIIPQMK